MKTKLKKRLAAITLGVIRVTTLLSIEKVFTFCLKFIRNREGNVKQDRVEGALSCQIPLPKRVNRMKGGCD
ncbi:MAG: hypothetical protein AXW15_01295 [Neptuniibacter sp. Phe_28]|nr:MAG: hypothetical protein AXW15_01295 [Neptuniibacter sp. Phe_28]